MVISRQEIHQTRGRKLSVMSLIAYKYLQYTRVQLITVAKDQRFSGVTRNGSRVASIVSSIRNAVCARRAFAGKRPQR